MENDTEKSPLISVIVPVYNNAAYLERCLNSIKAQTYQNLEVIIVNDGSTDDSETICNKYVADDGRFNYFYQYNAGVSAARNHGLREKHGDFFTFIDSDDWIEIRYCEKMVDKITEDDSDIVFCGMNYYKKNIKFPQNEKDSMMDIVLNRNVQHFLPNAEGYVLGSSCRTLFKSKTISQLCFNEKIHIYEDLLFLLESVALSKKLSFVDVCLYNYDLPETAYHKKYYRPGMIEKCYEIGIKLYNVLTRLDREDWGMAELFKQYSMAARWITQSDNQRQQFKELKKNKRINAFNDKQNYLKYKQLYAIRGFKLRFKTFLIHKKMFMTYSKLRSINSKS